MTKKVTVKDVALALGISRQVAARKLAGRPYTTEKQRGKPTKLYAPNDLPGEFRQTVMHFLNEQQIRAHMAQERRDAPPPARTAIALTASTSALVTSQNGALTEAPRRIADLARWQIDSGTARLVFIDELDAWAEALGREGALRKMARLAKNGELPERLQALVPIANARSGEKSGKRTRTLSVGSLRRWRDLVQGRVTPAERIGALAPNGRGRKWDLDADVMTALTKFRAPNKPPLAWAVRMVAAQTGASVGSLMGRCRRAIAHLPAPAFQVGRNTGAALKALRPFRRREFLSCLPNEIWVGDGHAAKLKVAHPITGNPFQPEVTAIIDVADRFIVGWSVSLSENCLAVSDALRHAVGQHGVPLIYYSDNGGGQKNKMFDAPVTGTATALGIRHETGRPGNPQGRGVIERLWATLLIMLARKFPTYQGRGHDRDTLKNITREINRDLRAAKNAEVSALPRKLPTWQQFIDALGEAIGEYNEAHQHRSLPKLNGTHHATPAQWRAHRLAESGVETCVPPPGELAALFMPQVMRKVSRGEVRLFGGIYYHADLMLIDGKEAPVGFDIHDNSRVLVRHPDGGELIAVAELNGNSSAYFPKPLVQRLADQRTRRRQRLLESKLTEVRAESVGIVQPQLPPPPAITEAERAMQERIEAQLARPAGPRLKDMHNDADKHRYWQRLEERRAVGEALAGEDAVFWASWQEQTYFRLSKKFDEKFEQQLAQQQAARNVA